ncbi:MAG TPA: hypothetical protein VFO01_01365 [Trebonia sp.]|nr:hypothetical protein [Trebonia sp.]
MTKRRATDCSISHQRPGPLGIERDTDPLTHLLALRLPGTLRTRFGVVPSARSRHRRRWSTAAAGT